jgi:putative ABC transport system permease protein
MFEMLWQDLRYAGRSLRRTPGFTLVVALMLALGIGANTAIFSLMDAVMFRPLAVPAPDELSLLYDEGPAARGDAISAPGLVRGDQFSWPLVQQLATTLPPATHLAAMTPPTQLNVRLGADPVTTLVQSQLVSGGFFSTFGATASLGRLLGDEDNRTIGNHPVAVVGYDFWQRQLSGRADVIGRSIPVNGVPFTIVGVANRGFTGVWAGTTIQLWVPLVMQQAIAYRQNASTHNADANLAWPLQSGVLWLNVVVRSSPEQREVIRTAFGLIREQQMRLVAGDTANPEMQLLIERQAKLDSFARGFSALRDQYSNVLLLLMGMVALLLLAACANVANLLLARSAARQRELGIRMSLGAGRIRFVRFLLVESLLLSVLGGVGAIAIAQWASTSLASFARAREVLPAGFALDARVLAFCSVVALLTSLVFGVVPALRTTRLPLASTLKTIGSRTGHTKVMRPLVVAQIALSLVLVLGAGLFGRSLVNLSTLDPGYDRQQLVQIRLNPRVGGVPAEELPALYARISERAMQVPGVVGTDLSYCGIATGCRSIGGIRIEGYDAAPGEITRFQENRVSASYFSTTGMRIVEGRVFNEHDITDQPAVVVINEAAKRKYFGGASPIGKRVGYGELTNEIVGVVGDARVNTLREEPVPMAFYPLAQSSERQFATAMDLRVNGDAAAVGETVRRVLAEMEPRLLANSRPTTIADQLDQGLVRDRLVAYLAGAFGILALVLACVGLYGVLSYAVAMRTSEMGVRMAVGATPGDLLRLVVARAMRLTAVGIVLGAAVAVGAARFIQTLLFGITPTDATTYAIVIAVLMIVALAASFVPARRAARVDPMAALRAE